MADRSHDLAFLANELDHIPYMQFDPNFWLRVWVQIFSVASF